jgi:hypothetical protein
MFYYLYQITNLVNNKIYVGVHKTHDINDGYMGSGKVIKSAIEKYGIDNFRKDILETFQDAKSMYAKEKEIVNDKFLLREDTYNLRRGGSGGFDYINKQRLNVSLERSRKGGHQTSSISRPLRDAQRSARMIKEHSIGDRTTVFSDPFFQKQMCERSNSADSIAKKKNTWKITCRNQGDKNPNFGTMWITNGSENCKLHKSDEIPQGWRKGRVMLKNI